MLLFRHVVGIGVLTASIIVFVSQPSFSVQAAPDTDVSGRLSDDQDEVVVLGQESGGNDAAGSNTAETITLQTVWLPTCQLVTPTRPSVGMCSAAARACPWTSDGPTIQMSRWIRQWDAAIGQAITAWEVIDVVCVGADAPVENVHALVLRLFEDRVKLMKAPLHIQPPNGRTLVNLDTIFWTVDPTRTFGDIPVLGHSVDLRILPTTYAWHFGDGANSETVMPGAPYPSKDVTHQYLGTGAVRPSLAVTYRGQYRVDDGAWIEMAGTATVDGPEVALTVVETRTQLIGG